MDWTQDQIQQHINQHHSETEYRVVVQVAGQPYTIALYGITGDGRCFCVRVTRDLAAYMPTESAINVALRTLQARFEQHRFQIVADLSEAPEELLDVDEDSRSVPR